MQMIIICLIIGIVFGSAYTYFKVKRRYQQELAQLRRIDYVDAEQKNREILAEPELTQYQYQMRYIRQCELAPYRPMNKEAIQYFYYLNEWIQRNQLNWYVSFEVSMGAFIRTTGRVNTVLQKLAFRSYNSKRVDFLLIDYYGSPRGVIEYHGSGHYLSQSANERMQVKMMVLQKVGIPLIEIPEQLDKQEFFERLQVLL
ncbi:hypothetical protein HK18_06160 [Commensalibacter intestini]|uniref:DUF2726 domain-containing protein n=1 Tax=Commensalibacter intestini TaxID=479936 RepID=A0A251ZWD8_9PROT|nr:DUF2726 domain-containing protein [Commensalibacter intestini]OUI78963.1 hypothetical protein HK18_06160 [Commensalibacter intestini]